MTKIIYSYSRDQAVEDGLLFNLNSFFKKEIDDLKISIPLFCTSEIYDMFIVRNNNYKKSDINKHAYYLLSMAIDSIKASIKRKFIPKEFDFTLEHEEKSLQLNRCKVIYDGEVCTLMMPYES